MSTWHTVIGLEIHVQLSTATKLFSRASTRYGATPNSQTNAIDLALPGTLPVLNQKAIDFAILLGHATGSTINQKIGFDRKNYFYPDLPKGYQITQHFHPILSGGYIDIEVSGEKKRIRLHHTHLEEDAGKSNHGYKNGLTGVDLNRAGIPLLEVVSEPDMRSPQEAVAFMKALHHLVVTLGICDGNMQEGSFRCDANISLRPSANAPFGTRVEIKNVNSFKFVEKALQYEIKRQTSQLEKDEPIKQQTRLFNEQTQKTEKMREKEQAHDYRYHPDPDIPFITIAAERIQKLKESLPELAEEKRLRYVNNFSILDSDAKIIAYDSELSSYFDELCSKTSSDKKLICNLLLGSISALMNKHPSDTLATKINTSNFISLLGFIEDGTVSLTMAKQIIEIMWQEQSTPADIIESKGLRQITDIDSLNNMISEVLGRSEKQVDQYRSGQEKLFGYFVGQVMKLSKGKAAPELLSDLLKQQLNQD